jgi:hypothetical protein
MSHAYGILVLVGYYSLVRVRVCFISQEEYGVVLYPTKALGFRTAVLTDGLRSSLGLIMPAEFSYEDGVFLNSCEVPAAR